MIIKLLASAGGGRRFLMMDNLARKGNTNMKSKDSTKLNLLVKSKDNTKPKLAESLVKSKDNTKMKSKDNTKLTLAEALVKRKDNTKMTSKANTKTRKRKQASKDKFADRKQKRCLSIQNLRKEVVLFKKLSGRIARIGNL